MKTSRFLFTAASLALVVLCLIHGNCARAFDFAIYGDARSGVNWIMQADTANLGWWGCPRSGMLSNMIGGTQQHVLDLYRDMGVTHLWVYWPFPDDYDFCRSATFGNMKIMNWSWPGGRQQGGLEGFKYTESQRRELLVGEPDNPDNPYVHRSCWGDSSHQTTWGPQDLLVIANGPDVDSSNAAPATMWRATADLFKWEGWDDREAWISGQVFMPMHFRVVCDTAHVDASHPEVVTIFWMVWGTDSATQQSGWWRYPALDIKLGDFATAPYDTYTGFYSIPLAIKPDTGTYVLCGNDFQPTAITDTSHKFKGFEPVRMCIYYRGHHDFYLREVDIYDEGYYRMFVRPDSSLFYDTLATAFRDQYNLAGGKQIGWYYDEWHAIDQIKSLVRVNWILQHAGLPTFIVNGVSSHDTSLDWAIGSRLALFNEMDRQQVRIPVHMSEFYMFGGGRTD